ncbi:MAG: ABC transporter permease [Bacteroidia bacterium]
MEFEIKPKSKFSIGFRELWQYRELFYFFTWRDIKVKYKQAVLGALWAVIQPAAMTLLFTFFFGKVFSATASNLPYPVYVLSGLLFWNIFSSGLNGAGNSMISNANIIKKVYFPRLIIPVSAILSGLPDFIISFSIFIGLILYYHVEVSVVFLLFGLISGLLLTFIATLGMGLWLSALNVKYRDFRYIIPFLIQGLLFVTPVIYPAQSIDNHTIHVLLSFNPMYCAVESFRMFISGEPVYSATLIYSMVSGITILFGGLYFFRKTENYFADLA